MIVFKCLRWVLLALSLLFAIPSDARPQSALETPNDGTLEENPTNNIPKIISTPSTQVVDRGGLVTFPCVVEDLGIIGVTWEKKRKSSVIPLYVGKVPVHTNSRITLDDQNSLKISDLEPTDSGTYACKVADPKYSHISVAHALVVTGPPTISQSPPDGKVYVAKNSPIKLTCQAGDAEIKWEKLNGKLDETLVRTSNGTLEISNPSRQDSGTYRCSAYTEIGQTSSKDFVVTVEDQPEIDIPQPKFYTGIGRNELVPCIVRAQPPATVHWERQYDGTRIEPSKNDDDYALSIKILSENDFGKYICRATNKYGTDEKTVEITGKPAKPRILNSDKDFPTSGDKFELKYHVSSYSPLTKVEIHTRTTKDGENFSDWNITEVNFNDDGFGQPEYNLNYLFSNMERKTYEVLVFAQNKYGQSEPSEKYSITTDGTSQHYKVAVNNSSALSASYAFLWISISLITSWTAKFC